MKEKAEELETKLPKEKFTDFSKGGIAIHKLKELVKEDCVYCVYVETCNYGGSEKYSKFEPTDDTNWDCYNFEKRLTIKEKEKQEVLV